MDRIWVGFGPGLGQVLAASWSDMGRVLVGSAPDSNQRPGRVRARGLARSLLGVGRSGPGLSRVQAGSLPDSGRGGPGWGLADSCPGGAGETDRQAVHAELIHEGRKNTSRQAPETGGGLKSHLISACCLDSARVRGHVALVLTVRRRKAPGVLLPESNWRGHTPKFEITVKNA